MSNRPYVKRTVSCNSRKTMSSRSSGCLRLYNLINRYKGLKSVDLTKEAQKEVLIVFSKVLREIRLWIEQLESSSEEDIVMKFSSSDQCSSGLGQNDDDNRFLAEVVADLVILLTVESQYVQHLAGNVLIAISEFLALSGSNWDVFLQLLCGCLRLAMLNMLSNCSKLLMTRSEDLLSDSVICTDILSPKLTFSNWSTMAGIVRVLRSILKSLNKDFDEQLIQAYISSITFCLSHVPWDLLDETFGQRTEGSTDSCTKNLSHRKDGEESSKVVFLGNLIQFLCSLVEQCSSVEVFLDPSNAHPLLLMIIDLVPKLSFWCLGKPKGSVKTSISQYLQYKLLVLLTRLSFQTCFQHYTSVMWLQLLQNYYWGLLQQPLSMPESSQDDCLQGSPFLLASSDQEACIFQSHHLQRQVIFLFLHCCFSLFSLSGQEEDQHMRTASTILLATDFKVDLEGCYRERGFLALYQWLRGHLPVDNFVDIQLYREKCTNFTLSFIQLYMHEDGLLFKVLLQLLSVPLCGEQREKMEFQDLEEEVLYHMLNIFNPVHLFHLFLAELHYDHQVLLDYLISKDSGVNCAEYLLKSLRTVCNSLDIFVNFSVRIKVTDELSRKRRKILLDGSIIHAELSSSSAEKDRSLSLGESSKRLRICGIEHQRPGHIPYIKAKECLSSLKLSVESLHQKKIFPYNPVALLKRLTQFEDLCSQTERNDILKK